VKVKATDAVDAVAYSVAVNTIDPVCVIDRLLYLAAGQSGVVRLMT